MKENENYKSWRKKLWSFGLKICFWGFGASQIYLFLRLHVFTSCIIPTSSMCPTILPGDYVYASLYSEESKKKKVKRNDIVIFHYPYTYGMERIEKTYKLFYCKRCVALPGDFFHIDSTGIYRIKGMEDTVFIGNRCAQLTIGKQQVNFDSIYIPKVGDEIQLNKSNYHLYKKYIEFESNSYLSFKNDTVYMDGKKIKRYKFTQNYYYMAGDNVAASYDSRYWGLVPEELLLGKAIFIWYSKDKESGKVRWERLFKRLSNSFNQTIPSIHQASEATENQVNANDSNR